MLSRYKIEKDKFLNCYIVWEVHRNYLVDVFRSKLKRDCKMWLEKEVTKNENSKNNR